MAALTADADLVPMRAGPLDVVLVADPGLARDLLTRPTGVGKGRGIDALKFLLGEGLLTAGTEVHRRQRRLINPLFAPDRIAGYGDIAVSVAERRAKDWRDGQRVDLLQEMNTTALDIVGKALFGADLRGDAAQIASALDTLLPVFPRLIRPFGFALLRVPNPVRARLRGATASLDAVVDRLIDARSAAPLADGDAGAGDDADRGPDDLLGALLAVRDEAGQPMVRKQVRDEALTLLLAGHETTAVAMAWTWLELSRHPDVCAWLETELDSAAGRSAVAAADWQRLPRTRAVIAESMRLHPPAHTIGRRLLEPQELGGRQLAAGTLCLISIYALHRDARSWSKPLDFEPGRWLDVDGRYDERAPGQPRGAYLPFGAGARICIGAQMAQMEAVLVMATLAQQFRAEVPAGFDPGNQAAVTLRPRRGIPATLRQRREPVA
jgi:cytochrome P450